MHTHTHMYVYIEYQFFHSPLNGYRHFTNGAHRARIPSTYVAALCSFVRFMHIRKVHSAYKCAPGLSERRAFRDAARGEYPRPSRHFSR